MHQWWGYSIIIIIIQIERRILKVEIRISVRQNYVYKNKKEILKERARESEKEKKKLDPRYSGKLHLLFRTLNREHNRFPTPAIPRRFIRRSADKSFAIFAIDSFVSSTLPPIPCNFFSVTILRECIHPELPRNPKSTLFLFSFFSSGDADLATGAPMTSRHPIDVGKMIC